LIGRAETVTLQTTQQFVRVVKLCQCNHEDSTSCELQSNHHFPSEISSRRRKCVISVVVFDISTRKLIQSWTPIFVLVIVDEKNTDPDSQQLDGSFFWLVEHDW